MSYQPWTVEQERILTSNAHMGAVAVTRLISEMTGISRSVTATKRHANRIGVSLECFDVCPGCGRLVRRLTQRTGLCAGCSMRHHADLIRDKGRENREREEEAEVYDKTMRREYDALRRQQERDKRA